MGRNEHEAARISRIFTRLRELVGASQAQLVRRSGGAIGRHELGKVERGHNQMTTEAKRKGVAAAYGIDVALVHDLIEGRRTVEEVAAVVPPFALDGAHRVVPSPKKRGRPRKAPTAAEQGATMATWVRLEHASKSRFPNLEICLLYHEANGKKWRDASVKIAREDDPGAKDRRPEEWAKLLDRLDGLVAEVFRRDVPNAT